MYLKGLHETARTGLPLLHAEPDGPEHPALQPPALRLPDDLRADGAVCAQVTHLLAAVELCWRCQDES